MNQYSIRDTKAKLSELLKTIPFEITNHNRVVAVVMAPDETAAILHAIENKPTGPMLVTNEGQFVKPVVKTVSEAKKSVAQITKEAPKSKLCPDCGSLLDIYGQCQNRFRHKKKK